MDKSPIVTKYSYIYIYITHFGELLFTKNIATHIVENQWFKNEFKNFN